MVRFLLIAGALCLGRAGAAQSTPPIAFVGVNVVPMDVERVLRSQTVLVRDGRVAQIGADVTIPDGTVVIAAHDRWLVPGLVDVHVHLAPEVRARPDFGDAPLFLASGVTSVLNLRGRPMHLEWRRRIENGTLVAPTLYTSGEFVNEPRVVTIADVEREVRAQKAAGYDVIKFREVVDAQRGVLTSTGLAHDVYRRLIEVARESGMPVIGHAPENLGLEAAIEAGQSLAHSGAFLFSHYWPHKTSAFRLAERWTVVGLLVVTATAAVGLLATFFLHLLRSLRRRDPSGDVRRRIGLTAIAAAGIAATVFMAARDARDLWWLNGTWHRALLMAGAVLPVLAALLAIVWAVRDLRTPRSAFVKTYGVAFALAVTTLALPMPYWLEIFARSTDRGMRQVAERAAARRVAITPTLVIDRFVDLPSSPALAGVSPRARAAWERFRQAQIDSQRIARAHDELRMLQRQVAALHRAGVPILVGTDAMGWPFMIPGATVHEELSLLVQAGLSPFHAMTAATTAPARFLGRASEFGTIATGRRADLVLVATNPLEDVSAMRRPLGVMVRGRWLPADSLDVMLARLPALDSLAATSPP